jgi:hypothetical protein
MAVYTWDSLKMAEYERGEWGTVIFPNNWGVHVSRYGGKGVTVYKRSKGFSQGLYEVAVIDYNLGPRPGSGVTDVPIGFCTKADVLELMHRVASLPYLDPDL